MCVKARAAQSWRSLHTPSLPIARKASWSLSVIPPATPPDDTRSPTCRFKFPRCFTSKGTKKLHNPLTIFHLPVELIIMVCNELDDIWGIWALQATCTHFKHLLTINEVTISKSMSRSASLTVRAASTSGPDLALASIYPLDRYGWPWADRPSYYWVSLLQSRSKIFRDVQSLNYHGQPQPNANFLTHAWDCDITHLFWSWTELPSDEAAFSFLGALAPRVCAGVCEFYFTAVFALTRLAQELPRPARVSSTNMARVMVVAPPIADMVRNVWVPSARLWELLEESERGLGPQVANCVSVFESTAALLGPFIMRDWAENIDFAAGISEEPDTPMRWPSFSTAARWLDAKAEDCIRQTGECYGRTNQLFLFYGIQKHQKRSVIERCKVELGKLRRKMADVED